MKIPNYLITSLAFVGAVSLIIMACSTDNATNSTTGTSSLTGKYQISSCNVRGNRYFDLLDTQTGVVKHYAGTLLQYTTDAGTTSDTSPIGRYQISSVDFNGTSSLTNNYIIKDMYIVDTQTGVVKYYTVSNDPNTSPLGYKLISTYNTQL